MVGVWLEYKSNYDRNTGCRVLGIWDKNRSDKKG